MTALIIIAVVVIIFIAIFSIKATVTAIYENETWETKVEVLGFKIKIDLVEILQKVLFPDKSEDNGKKEKKGKEKSDKAEKAEKKGKSKEKKKEAGNKSTAEGETEQKNPNFLVKMWNDEGLLGILSFVNNILSAASKAVKVLIKGFHIYSLYVKIFVGSGDAAAAANKFGKICEYYYPVKGLIETNLKVDNYDDFIVPDFIAERNEYEFQLIASLSVGTVVRCVLAAVIDFVRSSIKKQ